MANTAETAKPPSSLGGLVQRVKYRIKGASEAWFGPMQPLNPQAQQAKGRLWDYPVAFNLNYRPRATSNLSFADLQNLADNCSVLRSVIETRKDQIESLEWEIHPKKVNNKTVNPSGDMEARIKYVTNLFMTPSKDADWPQFLRQTLEQHFVYDAPALEMVPNRAGILCAIKVLDGATISVMLDADGGTPAPPYVAYQQVLKGLPAVDFTSDELLYYPRNRRPGFAYGYPHVAQIYQHVNLAIKRVTEQIMAYDGANAPHGVMEGGPSMTVDQITAMQQYWDSLFTGSIENRSKTWWVPAGSKYTALDREMLFNEFDEWLARVICYCFSISPTPFIKQNNRATAETSQDMAVHEGTKPTMMYLKRMIDRIIARSLHSPDLEFNWLTNMETDPQKVAEIATTYAKAGILTVDEVREELGRDAFGGAAAEPMVLTATGYVPIDPKERTDMATEAAKELAPPAPKLGPNGLPVASGKAAGAGPLGAKGKPPAGQKALAGPKKGVAAAKPKLALAKAETTEALFEVRRPLVNAETLAGWVKGLGLAPLDELVVKFTTFGQPAEDMPFLLVEDLKARIVKDEDGFRLYFDCIPLQERMEEANALEADAPLSILLDNTTKLDTVEAFPEFSGTLLFGAEEITKRWDAGAFDADMTPSRGRAEAGNYRKGHIKFQGLDITIENPAGSAREFRSGDRVLMPTHYGYIKGTVGADGDHVDCFVGPNHDAPMVYVIDQHRARSGGGFDEHKCMLGYDTWTAARKAYEDSYTDSKSAVRIGNAAMMSMEQFRSWLQTGDTTKPVAMAKDVTMATGLSGYDQGPVMTPRRRRKSEDESNDEVGEGPTLVKNDKPFSRWNHY